MVQSLSSSTPRQVVNGDGQVLAARTWGCPDGPAVVLIHGYPDSHRVWTRLAEELAGEHFVIAYDVRGAGDSFVPRATRAYTLAHLASDLQAVIASLSPHAAVHLVGHDWGAIQGWEAVTDPALGGLFASFTSISGPCLDHVGHQLRRRLAAGEFLGLARQARRSWYVGAFHLPVLAPLAWRLGLGRAWPRLLERSEGVAAEPQADRGATGAAGVALYRANVLARLLRPRERFATVPVQLLIPTRDAFVSPALADSAAPWVEHIRRVEVEAGHWLVLSRPAWLAEQIREFSASTAAARSAASAARPAAAPQAAASLSR